MFQPTISWHTGGILLHLVWQLNCLWKPGVGEGVQAAKVELRLHTYFLAGGGGGESCLISSQGPLATRRPRSPREASPHCGEVLMMSEAK
jgi:hypothetical protein